MTLKRAVALLLFACLAVPAATGIAALEDDDYCSTTQISYADGSELDQETSLLPPGWRCVYTQPEGKVSAAEAASTGEFLSVLAVELLVILLVAWDSPRVPAALRLSAASILAIGVAGLGGLLGGFIFAGIVGAFIGIPVGCGVDLALARGTGDRRRFLELVAAGAVSGLAGALFAFWWLFGLGVAAYHVALLLIAPLAYVAGRLTSTPATA